MGKRDKIFKMEGVTVLHSSHGLGAADRSTLAYGTARRVAVAILVLLLLTAILPPVALAKHTDGEIIWVKLFIDGKQVTDKQKSFTVGKGQVVEVKIIYRYYRYPGHENVRLTYDLNLYDDSRFAGLRHVKTIVDDNKYVSKGKGNQEVCNIITIVPSNIAKSATIGNKYTTLYAHLEVDDDWLWDSNEYTKKATIWIGGNMPWQVRLIGRIVQKGDPSKGVKGVKVKINKVFFGGTNALAGRAPLTATTDKYGLFAVTLKTSLNPVTLKGYEASFSHNKKTYTIPRAQTKAQLQFNLKGYLDTLTGKPTNKKELTSFLFSVFKGWNVPPAITSVSLMLPMAWTTKSVEVDVTNDLSAFQTLVSEQGVAPGPAFDFSYLLTSPSEAVPGDEVTCYIVLVNTGDENADSTCASLVLPNELKLLSESVPDEEEGWMVDGQALQWNGCVPVGQERTLSFSARLADTAEPGSRLLLEVNLSPESEEARALTLQHELLIVAEPPVSYEPSPEETDEPVEYESELLGMTLLLPPDWLVAESEEGLNVFWPTHETHFTLYRLDGKPCDAGQPATELLPGEDGLHQFIEWLERDEAYLPSTVVGPISWGDDGDLRAVWGHMQKDSELETYMCATFICQGQPFALLARYPSRYDQMAILYTILEFLEVPALTAEQPRNVVTEGDDYEIEGFASAALPVTGKDFMDLVLIGPDGYPLADPGLDVANGLEIISTPVIDNEWHEDITMAEGVSTGTWKVMVLAPGRDGTYGDLGLGDGELENIPTTLFAGKTQDQIVAIIKDRTIDATGSDDLLVELEFEVESIGGSNSLTVAMLAKAVAQEDEFTVEGTAAGSDFVDIVTIAPKGGSGRGINPASVAGVPGITHDSSAVSDLDYSYLKDLYVDEDADTGTYDVVVVSPGCNGVYDELNSAELFGSAEFDVAYGDLASKTQSQILAIIEDATIDAAGSDDLMVVLSIRVEIPVVALDPIAWVGVGEPLVVTGESNREEGYTIIVTAVGPVELTPATVQIENGTFEATFDTTDAVTGYYMIQADDGDGHTDEVEIFITGTGLKAIEEGVEEAP